VSTLAERTVARLERIVALAAEEANPEPGRMQRIVALAQEGLEDGLAIGCRVCGGEGKRKVSTVTGSVGVPCWCNAVIGQVRDLEYTQDLRRPR
jgi:hypothetical protein